MRNVINWAASWQNQKCGCAPREDSDQPGHPPSLIRVFAVRMKKAWLSYPLSAQRRLWSDWADAQADLSLRWAHTHFVGFVTRQHIIMMNCSWNYCTICSQSAKVRISLVPMNFARLSALCINIVKTSTIMVTFLKFRFMNKKNKKAFI